MVIERGRLALLLEQDEMRTADVGLPGLLFLEAAQWIVGIIGIYASETQTRSSKFDATAFRPIVGSILVKGLNRCNSLSKWPSNAQI